MPANQREEILHDLAALDGSDSGFEALAWRVFRYQAANNPTYARFLELLRKTPDHIGQLRDIPFLPISLFKSHAVQTGEWQPQAEFTSSGTTGQVPSRHLVRDVQPYLDNCVRGFAEHYGPIEDWLVLALLPSYLERTGSSLVVMAEHFIQRSRHDQSGFFLHDLEALKQVLTQHPAGIPVLLLGVSFALLDLAEKHPMNLAGVTVMETGGMKGRRRELTRPELHEILCNAFQIKEIHSEYGMTELCSQGYARGGNLFSATRSMRVFTTEVNDPFCHLPQGRTGQVNIMDLSNVDTCAFIATEDLGRRYDDGKFEIMGRMDTAEMRGCNLMFDGV
jgi:hypothetical protein